MIKHKESRKTRGLKEAKEIGALSIIQRLASLSDREADELSVMPSEFLFFMPKGHGNALRRQNPS